MKIDVGSKEAASSAAARNAINVAAMLREIAILREVAEAAIRLRAIGRACDKIDEGLEDLWRANPHLTKSGTQAIAASEAFSTAMSNFDNAVLHAVEAGMDWAPRPEKLGPR